MMLRMEAPTKVTMRVSLPWHHNLQDLMLVASSSLELSEMVLNKHRKFEGIEQGMAQGFL